MNKPKARIDPFAKVVARVPPPVQTRLVSAHGRVCILSVKEDGTIFEQLGRPSFLLLDTKAPTAKYQLPADYYLDGSTELLARRAELGLK